MKRSKRTWKRENVSEDDLADDGASNPHVQNVREMAKEEGSEVFVICAQIEQEIAELDDDEKAMFLEELGLKKIGSGKTDPGKLQSARTFELSYCRRR